MTTAIAGRGVIPVLTTGQRLVVAREYADLTQGELAERLGVSTATVQRAETGRTEPKRRTFMAWAMATGVDRQWLEYGTEQSSPPDDGGSMSTPGKPTGCTVTHIGPVRPVLGYPDKASA